MMLHHNNWKHKEKTYVGHTISSSAFGSYDKCHIKKKTV